MSRWDELEYDNAGQNGSCPAEIVDGARLKSLPWSMFAAEI